MPELRLIDESGAQLGIVSLARALELARERDLDLVEMAPNASPPVCRLLDYGKFRYLQARKERESRRLQSRHLLRQVRLRPRIGDHDMEVKAKAVRKLLETGAKVRVFVLFRGREATHPEQGINLLRRIAEGVKGEAKVEQTPTMEGRMLSIILAPLAHRTDHGEQQKQAQEVNADA